MCSIRGSNVGRIEKMVEEQRVGQNSTSGEADGTADSIAALGAAEDVSIQTSRHKVPLLTDADDMTASMKLVTAINRRANDSGS